MKFSVGIAVLFLLGGIRLAVAGGLTITVDPPSPQPVGTPVTFTVVGDLGGDAFDVRLREVSPTQPRRVLYDYSDRADYRWARLDEGWHAMLFEVRNLNTGDVQQLSPVIYRLTGLAVTDAVITPSANPMVAVYSAPPCAPGRSMRVRFRISGAQGTQTTASRPCRNGRGVNFHVAGMRASTAYQMRHEILSPGGQVVGASGWLGYLTGQAAVTLETAVTDPADAASSLGQGVLLQAATGAVAFPFATDLLGELIWYYDTAGQADGRYVVNRLLDGGRILMRAPDDDSIDDQRLWEIDLAGNLVRETTAARVSEQLVQLGEDPITAFHHESRLLPNGHLAVLGYVERILTDVQGPGDIDVLADMIIVLDEDLQVVWTWNGFDHLDPARVAILGEICIDGVPGCPPLALASAANDWMHSNAIDYSPADGALILSVRHQDWVLKIDYADGAGDGSVLWRLGPDGDLTLLPDAAPADVFPWHSHAHDPNFLSDDEILLYDNANTRCLQAFVCESRGQIYRIDELSMEATLSSNFDLGRYSPALGAAQLLANGNYHFGSGAVDPIVNPTGYAQELLPDGTLNHEQSAATLVYRSFRLTDLYTAP